MASQALNAVAGIITAVIIYLFIDLVRIRQSRRRYAKERKCQSAIHFPHREPFIGLDLFWQLVKSTKEKHRMESTKQLYDHYGLTWQSTSFGREVINTIDPENIQSVMAQDFESWGLAPLRYPAAGPFMGRGVFTSDGPFWQHARAQVKPVLTRAQFTDYERLEAHLQNFFEVLPKNGEDVDVLPLLERLFTDTMTEFLLGDSVDTLMGTSSLDHQAFLDSFTAAAQGVGKRIMLGNSKMRAILYLSSSTVE
ncbi:cytochrome P450 protein [Rutstroemia sp. NJR-2017a BBW]|nr:cytochrome P450 protein [Rutstroemia sp. NJR-2017a BBW]